MHIISLSSCSMPEVRVKHFELREFPVSFGAVITLVDTFYISFCIEYLIFR